MPVPIRNFIPGGSKYAKFIWRQATETGTSATTDLTVNTGLRPEAFANVASNGRVKPTGFWRLETIAAPTTGK